MKPVPVGTGRTHRRPLLAGIPELPGVVPGAAEAGHGGERPAAETGSGAGRHAGRSELILGRFSGELLAPPHRTQPEPEPEPALFFPL